MVWETDKASGFLERSVPGFGEHRAGLSIPPPEAHRGQARHTRWAGPCPAPLRCDPVLEARYPHFAGNRGTRQAQVTPEVTVTARGVVWKRARSRRDPPGRAREEAAGKPRSRRLSVGGARRVGDAKLQREPRRRAPLTCACAAYVRVRALQTCEGGAGRAGRAGSVSRVAARGWERATQRGLDRGASSVEETHHSVS